jgi:hypothetical protein
VIDLRIQSLLGKESGLLAQKSVLDMKSMPTSVPYSKPHKYSPARKSPCKLSKGHLKCQRYRRMGSGIRIRTSQQATKRKMKIVFIDEVHSGIDLSVA